jgi:hypothetical protein
MLLLLKQKGPEVLANSQLILWYLTYGIYIKQCDAQNTECKVEMAVI